MKIARHYINGEWIDHNDLDRQDIIDPANGETVGLCIRGTPSLAEEAIDVAYETFHHGKWAQSPRLRAQVLLEYADRIEAIKPALTEILVKESGKTKNEASHEINAGITESRYYAGLARNIFGRMTETEPGQISYMAREPAGVAAIITPWNAPVTLLVRSLAPALAAGCTTVIKPSPQTGLSHQMMIQCLDEIEALPKGVINSLNGDREDVGESLVASPKVDVISFTGSSGAGKAIMAATSVSD